jgi:sugar phosphate isomerase/epimerase
VHPPGEVRSRLGLQILFDFNDILDGVEFARDQGFGVLELNLGNINFSRQLASKRQRERIRAAAEKARVKLAAHAIDGPSLFIPSPRAAKAAVSDLKRVMDQAKEAGISRVVMHLGWEMYYALDGRPKFLHDAYPEWYERSVTDSIDELKRHARGRTRLCIENVGGFRFGFVHRILDRMLGGSLGLCFDVGHVNTLSPAKRRKELAFFRRHRRLIFHSHLHDNHGREDEHLAIGMGNIDFVPMFRLLAETPALLVFEVRPKEGAVECLGYFDRRIAPKL